MRNSICVRKIDLPPDARVAMQEYSGASSFDVRFQTGPVHVPNGGQGSRGFRSAGLVHGMVMGPWGGPNGFVEEAPGVVLGASEYAICGTLGNYRSAWFEAGPRAFARLTVPGLGVGDLDTAEGILSSGHDCSMSVFLDWRTDRVGGGQGLSPGEKRALGIFGGYKPYARAEALAGAGLGPYHPEDNEHLAGLVRKGLLTVRRNGSMLLSADGKVARSNLPDEYR